VYQGCNIENASFTPTICAERTAFFKAVYDGHRDFVAIAVCGGKDGVISGIFPPCGVCRQVMREFCKDDFRVYLADVQDTYREYTLAQLLPCSFSPEEHMA
jgi:cytidine deaminase